MSETAAASSAEVAVAKPSGNNYEEAKALVQTKDPNAPLREAGNNADTANNANLSGRPVLVKAFNSPDVVR